MAELAAFNFLCAVIAAKWAMDLGVAQARQLLFAIGGLLLGPLVLLALYVYLLYKAQKEGSPAARIL